MCILAVMGTLQTPTAGTSEAYLLSACVTSPAGFVKLTSIAPGAESSRISDAIFRMTGIVRIAAYEALREMPEDVRTPIRNQLAGDVDAGDFASISESSRSPRFTWRIRSRASARTWTPPSADPAASAESWTS